MIYQESFEKCMARIYVICMIGNVINMIIWGMLAIFFGKWWLTLFSILFIQSPKFQFEKQLNNENKN